MAEAKDSAVDSGKGPILSKEEETLTANIRKEGLKMIARVGKQAPDFTTKAYHEGMAKEIKLSDYRGKWVMLCFYPADFTCV
jgi:peroxiredoxin (alkyl hydroperoxide reductase subunit C)